MGDKYKPGNIVPTSGQYGIVKGGHLTKDEITAVKGHIFPPTQKPNQKFVLVDKTK